ncbi:MAG: DUF1614 domain-containing protein [Candidatus Asgardarchaeia archaeon]
MGFIEYLKKLIYLPVHLAILVIYLIVALFPLILLLSFYGIAFYVGLGLSGFQTMVIIFLSLIGSTINIPVAVLEQHMPIITEKYIRYMGIMIRIPTIDFVGTRTVLAVNLGGCIIPTTLSLYLLFKILTTTGVLPFFTVLIATGVNAIIINQFAKPIKGVGIATPWFVPPLVTSIITIFFAQLIGGINIFAFAYITGTLGTLIGADLMNLKEISNLGTPAASIGGAGTFDGIFLTGVMSIFLLMMF